MLKTNSQRGLVSDSEKSLDVQNALGGKPARNTLSNALIESDPKLMIEAWMLLLRHYGPFPAKKGKRFAHIAAVDASLINLSSLQAFDWAKYRKKNGAAKITCVFNRIPSVLQ